MIKYKDKLVLVFEVARKINEALWLGCVDSRHMSIDELQDHISETFDVKIDLALVDVENDHVLGFIERYDGGRRARVYLVKNISPRQKRLVAVKELCHVAIDLDEDFSTDAIDTLERMVTVGLDPDAPENLAVRSEHLAEMVAWELLYPYEHREEDKNAIAAGTETVASLAQRYQIPEDVIEMVLRAPYMEMCKKYWQKVHLDQQANVVAIDR